MNSLSVFDIEYMAHCSLLSSFKIFQITQKLNQEELSAFIEKNFYEDARINISQLIKWCSVCPEINHYFRIIKREPPHNTEGTATETAEQRASPVDPEYQTLIKTNSPHQAETSEYLNTRDYQRMVDWVSTFYSKIDHPAQITCQKTNRKLQIRSARVTLSWIYGIRCTDVVNSFVLFIE